LLPDVANCAGDMSSSICLSNLDARDRKARKLALEESFCRSTSLHPGDSGIPSAPPAGGGRDARFISFYTITVERTRRAKRRARERTSPRESAKVERPRAPPRRKHASLHLAIRAERGVNGIVDVANARWTRSDVRARTSGDNPTMPAASVSRCRWIRRKRKNRGDESAASVNGHAWSR